MQLFGAVRCVASIFVCGAKLQSTLRSASRNMRKGESEMAKFHIFAQREVEEIDLVKRVIDGDEDLADQEIMNLEDEGYEISDVHVYYSEIVQQQTTPMRHHRGRK